MRVLAMDSSGLVASVAIVEDDTLIAEYTVNYKKTHSQTLLPMLDERTPDAFWVIEYTDPALHGMPVLEDARLALSCRKQA